MKAIDLMLPITMHYAHVGHFDLKGSSCQTLRTHITIVEDENDFDNKCRYAMKDGNCIVRLRRCPFEQANAPPANGNGAIDGEAKWTDAFDLALKTCDSAREVAEAVGKVNDSLHVCSAERMCLS